MRTHSKFIKMLFGISLLSMMALLLSACSAAPANNYAGLTTDGKVLYVTDGSYVFQVDPGNGTQNWKFPEKSDIKNAIFAAPAVANGWVYIGTYGNAVYGLKLDGLDTKNPKETWKFDKFYEKGRIISSPLAFGDTVYVASTDANLYALGANDGALKWTFKGRNSFWSTPASDGKMIYQAGMDHYLYAIDAATGTKSWEIDLGGPALGNIVLSKEGMLYASTLNSDILAINTASQKIVWQKKLAGSVWSAPLLYKENLYFGTDKNNVYILNALEGTEVKIVDAGGSVVASPVYTQDAVFITTEAGDAFSLSLDGSNKIWTRALGKVNLYATPVVVGEQIIYSVYQGQGKNVLGAFDFKGTADDKWTKVTLK